MAPFARFLVLPLGSLLVAASGGATSSSPGDGGPCAPNLTGRLRDFVNKPGFTPASA